jgi:hypothetical protein
MGGWHMGELGAVRRYHYWSDRSVRQIAVDNDIALTGRLRWGLRFPSFPFIAQLELGQEASDLRRNEVARMIETAIGLHAVEDFVTPPPVSFAKGVGHMEIARTTVRYASANDGVVIHFTVKSSDGARVEMCLFGSIDNTPHYISAAPSNKSGWTSSAWYAIEELLLSHGTKNTSQWDDDEKIAVEALGIALHQGETGHTKVHKGKPWTRGFTIGSADDVEWFAVIYKDVELTKNRWRLDHDVDRILIGAPLWIRTAHRQPIMLYHKASRTPSNS